MDKNHIAIKIWDILYPILFYYALSVAVHMLAGILLGTDTGSYMLRQSLVAILTIPAFYYSFYKPDALLHGKGSWKALTRGKQIAKILLAVSIALLLATGLNNLILMTPLVSMSEGYVEANANFYGSTLGFELLGSGILMPVLEELVFRGVLLGRLTRFFGKRAGILLSACFFGIIHFNLVQFVFAFAMGLVFAILVEEMGHISVSIWGHIAVNTLAVLRTEFHFMDWSIGGSFISYVFLCLCLGGGLILLGKIINPEKK